MASWSYKTSIFVICLLPQKQVSPLACRERYLFFLVFCNSVKMFETVFKKPEEWKSVESWFCQRLSDEWMHSITCTYSDMFQSLCGHTSPFRAKNQRSLRRTLHHRWQRVLFGTEAGAGGSYGVYGWKGTLPGWQVVELLGRWKREGRWERDAWRGISWSGKGAGGFGHQVWLQCCSGQKLFVIQLLSVSQTVALLEGAPARLWLSVWQLQRRRAAAIQFE